MITSIINNFVNTILFYFVNLKVKYNNIKEKTEFIQNYSFNLKYFNQLKEKYPTLSYTQFTIVSESLKSFFILHLKCKNLNLGMPSVVADELWHIFIEDADSYEKFCKEAFGYILEHIPEKNSIITPVSKNTIFNKSIKNTYRTCEKNNDFSIFYCDNWVGINGWGYSPTNIHYYFGNSYKPTSSPNSDTENYSIHKSIHNNDLSEHSNYNSNYSSYSSNSDSSSSGSSYSSYSSNSDSSSSGSSCSSGGGD